MPAGGTGRGPYAGSAGRRAEILTASAEVFAESGYHGGTIREVAQRVRLSQAGLLHHFATKAALLEAVVRLRDDLVLERWGDRRPTGRALLDAFVELMGHNSTAPGLVALYAVLSGEGTAADHPGHDYFTRRFRWVLGLLEEAVRDGQQAGELRTDVDPELASRTLVALCDGLQVQWLYDARAFDLAAPVRAYVASLALPSPR